jgi:hypothetical protein
MSYTVWGTGRVARSPTLVFRGLEGLLPATSYLYV